MNGFLIVNNFISSSKFSELYEIIVSAAKRASVNLIIKKTGEIPHNLDYIRNIKCDFILFWDKDVVLAKMFEICGYKVFNSSDAINYCDNKAYTVIKLAQVGISIPKTFIAPLTFEGVGYSDLGFAYRAVSELKYPIVIKEIYGSFGQQVYLVQNDFELEHVIKKIGYRGFIIQEFIKSSYGKDVRINVVGEEVISAMLRYNKNGDFRSNISNGGNMKEYFVNTIQSEVAVAACKALNLDFAGVDVLFGEDGKPIICEVNSNPNFKSSFDCTGIDVGYEILKYIKGRLG